MEEVILGQPLPAHTLIIGGGSPRFLAQIDRWSQEAHGSAAGSKPVLRVPLDGAEDLPHAISAVRFMYTGKLDVSRAAELLQVRRLAAYLQVEGCQTACDTALVAIILNWPPPGQPATRLPPVLDGVAELYDFRHCLLEPGHEETFAPWLMEEIRMQLAHPLAYAPGMQAVSPGRPTPGELLAWAFGDAPAVLNDVRIRQRLQALPAAALEALLVSNDFATDDEASVLLMVAEWLHSRRAAVTDDERQRLCDLIRLPQLNETYLHRVLPNLTWFPISRAELQFVCEFALADYEKYIALAEAKGLDVTNLPPRYELTARPKPILGASGRDYEWAIGSVVLAQLGPEQASAEASFPHAVGRVYSRGFAWRPLMELESGSGGGGGATLHLQCCALPDALQLEEEAQMTIVAAPKDLSVTVYEWGGDGERREAWSGAFGDCAFVRAGHSIRFRGALPLAAAGEHGDGGGGVQADRLAAWRPYLKDGALRGVITMHSRVE